MPQNTLQQHSLVLYKNRPALVERIGDKLEIKLEDGRALKVRPKDVLLLHPGPARSLAGLHPPNGEVETAWELLAGTSTTLPDLADLIYEAYTPATAWAVWQLVDDGLYFRGNLDEIFACTAEEVAQTQAARQAKAAEAQAWSDFVERVRAGQQILADDRQFLRETEDLALARRERSRLLNELNRAETPESAHALLLEVGYWDETVNPYPQRFNVTTTIPTLDLPGLPPEERLDLTHLPAFAIDDEGSQDPDDALSLDGSRLWVHVADVAALIPPDSPADLEARARGANLYLPEGTAPMLPPQATQTLALGLADISPALSFGLEVDGEGKPTLLEIRPSWVRITRQTYEAVDTQLDTEPFATLYRIARLGKARRQANGAANIELPEVKIQVRDGQVIIRSLPPLKSRDLVQEAMQLCGEAIARYALAQQIPFPFATQDAPEERQSPQTISEMFAYRRTFQRSQVKSVPGPHAGMGLEIYTQATSPLRRYSDLVAHQQLRAYLRGDTLLSESEILERIGAAEAVTGSVRQAERLSNKHWTLVYLQQNPGWRGQGILVDKRNRRGRVLLPDLDLEIRLHLRQDLPLDTCLSLVFQQANLPELEAYFQIEER